MLRIMGINLNGRVTPGLVIPLVLGAVGSCIIVVVAAIMIGWHHSDDLNAQRLKILQADGVLHCRAAKISPWHEKEEANADLAGTTHGIGFGGRTLTSVTRLFSLNDADPANAINTFTVCAQSSGWMLAKRPYVALSGIKSFPGGWKAYLSIYIEDHTPSANQPIVQVDLKADPI
jgi:hypothetical protein